MIFLNIIIRIFIPRDTEGYRFGLVRLSVRLSHPKGGCLVDITFPSLDVPRGVFHVIFDTNKDYRCATLTFQFDHHKLSKLKTFKLRRNSCFICA